jgi:Protein of unknown function (DUF2778)
MNIFESSSGKFYNDVPDLLAIGYAGGDCGARPDGVNNPALQNVVDVGPLPVGLYRIGPPFDHGTKGPYFMSLTPDPANEMYGRSGFGIHGDLITAPGQQKASDGCIILPKLVREQIWNSGDHDLRVVATLPSTN